MQTFFPQNEFTGYSTFSNPVKTAHCEYNYYEGNKEIDTRNKQPYITLCEKAGYNMTHKLCLTLR